MSKISKITNAFKYKVAQSMRDIIVPSTSNTYVTIGRPINWGIDAVETSDEVEESIVSTDYTNIVRRSMMAAKRVQAADLSLVVPRNDWKSGTTYDKYNDHIEIFNHVKEQTIGFAYANANTSLTGTVNVNSGSSSVLGSNTYFVGNVFIGASIVVNSQSRVVSSIVDNTTLEVSSSFTYSGIANTYSLASNSRYLSNTSGLLFGNVSVGSIVSVGDEVKEIIEIKNNYVVVTNTKFNYSYAANAEAIILINNYPLFAYNFYVRNTRDQVFKCLDVGTGASTIEPTIDIDGQLPENPYIETGDQYKWKYLYTIPYGMKQKFFTKEWMPVITDSSVESAAVDGRIDIIEILSGGSGYYLNNGYSGNIASYDIVTIIGDGQDAYVTAKIQNGIITKLNILDGGKDYTKANISISDPNQLSTGNVSSFDVVIGPNLGHGANPAKELGCYSFMISTELNNTESGKIPITSLSGNFDFRQVAMLRDPISSDGAYATGSVYRTTTLFTLSDPGTFNYQNDETVYVGSSLETAIFSGTVANWNPSTNELFLINLDGDYTDVVGQEIKSPSATAAVLSIQNSELKTFSGDTLYIENRLPITRNVDQSEQIRLVFSF